MIPQEQLDELKKIIEVNDSFTKNNNIKIVEVKKDYAVLKADITPNSLNPYGMVHGGLLFGIADAAMGICARTTGKSGVTVNANIDYLKPGKDNQIFATAEAIKVGNTISVYKCSIRDSKENLLAIVTGTFYFIK